MKISTKGRYGLRAIVDLAVNSSGEHIPLSTIAKRQDISVNYLEQVFSTLKNVGLIKSIKGAKGGYVLTRDPSDIKVGEILRILEGDLSIIDDSNDKGNDAVKKCINIMLWDKINDNINKIVDSITIEDLVNEHYKIQGNTPLMYII